MGVEVANLCCERLAVNPETGRQHLVERAVPTIIVRIVPTGMSEAEPIDVSHVVIGLKYKDDSKKSDRCTITIDNTDLANFDEPIWRTGSLMLVQWGYPQALSAERRMRIRKVSGFQKLEIEAVGGALTLDRIERVQSYKAPGGIRYSDVARIIAARWGFRHSSVTYIEETSQTFPVLNQFKVTDAQYLRWLANRVGFEWFIQYDGFHFHSRNYLEDATKKPRVFRYNATSTFNEVMNVAIKIDTTRVPGSLGVTTYTPDTRVRIDIDATGMSEEVKGAIVAMRAKGPSVHTASDLFIPGIDDYAGHHRVERLAPAKRDELKKNALAALQKAQSEVVKLSFTTIGDPNLYAKTRIYLDGVGKRLSQYYYVKSVEHTVAKGYTCELECVSDGSNGVSNKSRFTGATIISMNGGDGTGIANDGKPYQDVPLERRIHTLDDIERVEAREQTINRQTAQSVVPEDTGQNQSIPTTESTGPAEEVSDPETQYKGALYPGTIDLDGNPPQRDDGKHVTARPMVYKGIDGMTYVIPTVDERGGEMNPQAAAKRFQETNQHFGRYNSTGEAAEAAKRIEESQASRIRQLEGR